MKRILALATLLAAASGLCCSTPQPVQSPDIKAQLQRTLAGHSEVVWQVAFSPDGQWLAGSGYVKTVKL